jgi:hypothetical protein
MPKLIQCQYIQDGGASTAVALRRISIAYIAFRSGPQAFRSSSIMSH